MSKLVPIKDAAVELGVSELTVQRRIEANELLALRDETPHGHRCLVVLDDDAPLREELVMADRPADPLPAAPAPGSAQHPHTDRLIGSLADRLTFAENELRFVQAQLIERTREIEQLHTLLSQALRALPTGSVGLRTSPSPAQVTNGGSYADGGPPDEPTPHADRSPGRGLGCRRALRPDDLPAPEWEVRGGE